MSGSALIPHNFVGEATDSIDNFMANWTYLAAYINARELTVGLLANRPAAGINGQAYLATDVQSGTLYLDNGSVWTQSGAGVSGPVPVFVPALPYVSPYF